MLMENAIDSDRKKINNTKPMNWKQESHKAAARHNPGLQSKDTLPSYCGIGISEPGGAGETLNKG